MPTKEFPLAHPSIWWDSEGTREEKTQYGTRLYAPFAKKVRQRKKLRTPGRDNPEWEMAKPILPTRQIKSPITRQRHSPKSMGARKRMVANNKNMKKVGISSEYFANRKWTKFLNSLPVGISTWTLESFKDLPKLRVVACGLNKKFQNKTISINTISNDDRAIIIEVRNNDSRNILNK